MSITIGRADLPHYLKDLGRSPLSTIWRAVLGQTLDSMLEHSPNSLSWLKAVQTLRRNVNWKRRMTGGVLGVIGFMLSPLSWWNDLFVNVPLAVGFGWVVSLFYSPAFEPAVILGYWLTNVLGLVLMHRGIRRAATDAAPRSYSWRDLLKDVAVSLAYTLLIVALVHWKVLQPVGAYFKEPAPPLKF